MTWPHPPLEDQVEGCSGFTKKSDSLPPGTSYAKRPCRPPRAERHGRRLRQEMGAAQRRRAAVEQAADGVDVFFEGVVGERLDQHHRAAGRESLGGGVA